MKEKRHGPPKSNNCAICVAPLNSKGNVKYCKQCKPWVRRLYNTVEILKRYKIVMTMQQASDWVNEFIECVYCRQEIGIDEIAIDHILPKSRGGPDNIDNLQVIHKRCNMIKGAMTHEEYLEFIKVMSKLPKQAQKLIEKRLLQSGFIFRR